MHEELGMHIRFDIPADPAYAGRVAAALGRLYLRKNRLLAIAFILLGLAGLVVPLLDGHPATGAAPGFVAMVVLGAIVMFMPQWMRSAVRRRGGMSLGGPTTVDITETNVTMHRVTSTNGLAWDGIDRVSESKEFWILWVGRFPAMAVPRTLMQPEDAQVLRRFLVDRRLLAPTA
jgi:hypothetical protein